MSKIRMIKTKFWEDNYTSELDPIEKLLFLYLLTNPMTNVCGVYEIPLKRIAFDTGIDKEMVLKVLERFSNENKIFYISGWILIANFQKHQTYNPNMKIGAEKAIKNIPERIWLEIANNKTLTKAFGILPKRYQKPEPEPEPEPEEYMEDKSSEEPIEIIEEFSSNEYINEMLNDKREHIILIGKYYKTKCVNFPSKKAAQDDVARWVKDARTLIEYSEERINKTFAYVQNKFPEEWNLSTIKKYIANNKQ